MKKKHVQNIKKLPLQSKKYVRNKTSPLRECEELYRSMLNASPDGIAILDMDGRVHMASAKMLSMLGLNCAEEATGRALFDFIVPEDHAKARANIDMMFQGVFAGPGEYRGLRADGQVFDIETNAEFMRNSLGVPTGILLITRDIGTRKKAEDKLRESEARIRAITNATQDAVLMMEPNGRISFWNPAATRIFGYTGDEALGKNLHQFLTPQRYRETQQMGLVKFQQTGLGSAIDTTQEAEACHKDGHEFSVELSLSAIQLQDGWHAIGTVRDISARKMAETALEESNRKLEALSVTDALTGIANRRRFDDVLTREYSRHVRSGADLSLIMLDIDYFKAFNDCYGHVAGDACLRQIAGIMEACVARPADMAARYGGEEFACILPETDLQGAISVAETIRCQIQSRSISHKKSPIADFVTVSLGVVTVKCRSSESIMELVVKADELLYRAKSLGRNRIEFVEVRDVASTAEKKNTEALMKLVWKAAYCSGNPLIDSQHQSLFYTANELLDAVLSDRPAMDISPIIARLLAEVSQHFNDEQGILESVGFPGAKRHLEEHNKLLAKGVALSQQFNAATLSVGDVFQFLVYDVVMIHMFGADREYFSFLEDAVP